MEELELLQSLLGSVNAQANRIQESLKRYVAQNRSHSRQAVIEGIPGFWASAISLVVFTLQVQASTEEDIGRASVEIVHCVWLLYTVEGVRPVNLT